jgi:hypothetical protein
VNCFCDQDIAGGGGGVVELDVVEWRFEDEVGDAAKRMANGRDIR